MKVTWLLAVRNGLPYLPETLAAIEAQTFRDWEILVWDNGSTDGTVEELHRWIPARLPGRVVSERPFAALGASRAALVAEALTPYGAWIDADDVALPMRLAEQVAFLDAHPDVAVVGGQMELIDERSQPIGLYGRLPTAHEDLVPLLLANAPLAQPSTLFRREAVLAVGNYADVGRINVEDYDLWLRLAYRYRLANLPTTLVRYRVHPASTTVQATAEGTLRLAADECFYRHGPALFGCTPAEARLLRERKAPFAFPILWRIGRHLERTQGGSAWSWRRQPAFLDAAIELVAPGDWRTRLGLALLQPRPAHLFRDLARLAAALLRRAGLGGTVAWLRRLARSSRS